jgi:hypothetical protein
MVARMEYHIQLHEYDNSIRYLSSANEGAEIEREENPIPKKIIPIFGENLQYI